MIYFLNIFIRFIIQLILYICPPFVIWIFVLQYWDDDYYRSIKNDQSFYIPGDLYTHGTNIPINVSDQFLKFGNGFPLVAMYIIDKKIKIVQENNNIKNQIKSLDDQIKELDRLNKKTKRRKRK